eukprot:gene6793-7568_t
MASEANVKAFMAVQRGDIQALKQLLCDKEFDPASYNEEGCTVLYLLTNANNHEGMKILLDHGVDVDQENIAGFSAMYVMPTTIKLLLLYGASIDKPSADGITPLCYAAESGGKDLINFFVQSGASVNSRSRFNTTPLFHAARCGCSQSLSALIDLGADAKARADDGSTPMFEAARNGHILCLPILKRAGTNPFAQVEYGATAMHIAAFNGHSDCVRLFVYWGCDPNATTKEGCTSLHYAAYMGQIDCVATLLSLGCSPWARSTISSWGQRHGNENRLALDFAQEQYRCTDNKCVCYTQVACEVRKYACAVMIKASMCTVPSLADLCRVYIRSQVPYEHIGKLNLPMGIVRYLMYESKYTKAVIS